jgi:hypothetical protein
MAEARATNEDLYALCWEQGDLSPLMHAGQRRLRDQFHAWRVIDQTNDVVHVAGSLPRVFGVRGGKRFGKTTCALWLASELCVLYPGCSIRYTSAFQKTIDEIIGSVQHVVFDTAPDSCRPTYFGKRGPRPAGFYFPEYGPMQGARIALAGMELNPDALRGQGNDFDFISEAAFIGELGYTVINVLYHQYQGRPHARLMLESSAPKDVDTDWELKFLPDCERRGAIFTATIEDNPRLSRNEKDEFIAASGGRGHPDCEREYFNVISRDARSVVFPEFDKAFILPTYELPKHGLALASYDPGQKHLFAINWSVYDFLQTTVTFVDDWSEHNASTEKVAAITAARELDLFGTHPPKKLARLELHQWQDLLGNDRTAHLAEQLYELAQEGEEHSDFTWYDNEAGVWRMNPHLRVSDVNQQLINDMATMFGLFIDPTTKDDLCEVMVQLVRSMHKQKRVFYGPLAANTAAHMNACTWDKNRRKWTEHSVWSHFDLAATVMYGLRYWENYYHIDPYPPKHLGKGGPSWVGEVRVIDDDRSLGDFW